MDLAPEAAKFDLFISYSRQDTPFVRRLHDVLTAQRRRAWVDWEGIPPSADWMQTIRHAIEGADTFVFVVSPASLASEVCLQEVAHAVECRKRLIPVVLGEIAATALPEALRRLNWIVFGAEGGFDAACHALKRAIETDLDWVRDHTRLLVRAVEWRDGGREPSLLLRGADLREAEAWLAEGADREPRPTPLQRDYVLAGRALETRRSRRLLAAVTAGAILAIGLAALAWQQRTVAVNEQSAANDARNEALRQRDVAEQERKRAEEQQTLAQQRQMQAQEQAALALTNGITASLAAGHELEALGAAVQLGHQLRQRPDLNPALKRRALVAIRRAVDDTRERLRIKTGHRRGVTGLAFAADDSSLFTAGGDGQIRRWGLDGRLLHGWDSGHGGKTDGCTAIANLAASHDGQTLASLGNEGDFALWSMQGRKLGGFSTNASSGNECSEVIDSTIDFRRRVLRLQDGKATLEWPFGGKEPRRVGPGGTSSPSAGPAVVRADRAWTARPQNDGTLLLQPRDATQPARSYGQQAHPVFSRGGDRLATAATSVDDSVVHLWDLLRPEPQVPPEQKQRPPQATRTLLLGGTKITVLAGSAHRDGIGVVSLDGRLAASVSDKRAGKVALWQPATGPIAARRITEIETGQSAGADFSLAVLSLAFSPDGRRLATGGSDGTVKIWDAGTGKLLHEIVAHQIDAHAMFSADGLWLLTHGRAGVGDAYLRLFGADGEPLDTLLKGRAVLDYDEVLGETWFSPDGRWLLARTGPDDRERFHAWSLDLDELMRTGCRLLERHLASAAATADEKAACP